MDLEKQLLEVKKMLLELESAITKQANEKHEIKHVPEVPKEDEYLTVKQFCGKYSYPSISGMRHIIFFKDTNGFREAFFNINKRVLIDAKKFWEIAKSKG